MSSKKIYRSLFNGVYFMYIPLDKQVHWMSGMWSLADQPDGSGLVMEFDADRDRLSYCINTFTKLRKEWIDSGNYIPLLN